MTHGTSSTYSLRNLFCLRLAFMFQASPFPPPLNTTVLVMSRGYSESGRSCTQPPQPSECPKTSLPVFLETWSGILRYSKASECNSEAREAAHSFPQPSEHAPDDTRVVGEQGGGATVELCDTGPRQVPWIQCGPRDEMFDTSDIECLNGHVFQVSALVTCDFILPSFDIVLFVPAFWGEE